MPLSSPRSSSGPSSRLAAAASCCAWRCSFSTALRRAIPKEPLRFGVGELDVVEYQRIAAGPGQRIDGGSHRLQITDLYR